MTDHMWLHENLDAYLAGGLEPDERARVDRHLAECPDCARALENAKKMETYMTDLFTPARPDAALEDRVITRLRRAAPPRPSWLRFVYAAAAVIVLGMIGAGVQAVAIGGGLPFPGGGSLRMAQNAEDARTVALNGLQQKVVVFDDTRSMSTEFEKTAQRIDESSIDFYPPALAVTVRGTSRTHTSITGGIVGGKGKRLEAAAGETVEGKKAPVQEPDKSRTPLGFLDGEQRAVIANGRLSTDGLANAGGSALVQFAPVFVSPNMGWAKSGRDLGGKQNLVEERQQGLASFQNTFGYFIPADSGKHDPAKTPPAKESAKNQGVPPDPNVNVDPRGFNAKNNKKIAEAGFDDFGFPKKPAQAQPELPPDPGLKIIRTGEMEFQVASFDEAVASIVKLIGGVKGGFKLKEDSTKQPNGKTRGHVVVRMPPQFLDKFVLDLRRDLAKLGAELRTQRIGSQDVTKQFTDTESELKAARAVEKRLIEIIKTGKGEVKDLIAAERELGTWRTKIEKMEGEIRYYANQVALSTLTINLVEKEIEAASALVVSAKVQMRIEVDDVTKARETAEKAVADLKGRLLKSDEKQHPAGQVEAIVQAEIPPKNRSAFTAVLNKLGIVSAHEEAQTQTAEGGAGQPINVTPRVNNVVFDVKLNNIVNIEPKHSIALDIVTTDVSANYSKLREAILQISKGQIRDAKLNEADKQKAAALLVFNVPIEKKAAFDKVLAEVGPVLKRENKQVEVTQMSTAQKFGYIVNLYSVGVIAPREEVAIKVEARDVKKKAAEVLELVRASKGEASAPIFTLNPQGQMTALIKMRVPLSANAALVSSFMNERRVVEWKQAPNPNVPENELSTAQITLLLIGGNPLVPDNEGIWSRMRSGLYIGFTVFAWCITVVIIGLCGVLPWAIVLWLGYKAVIWMTGSSVQQPAAAAPKPASGEAPKT